MTPKQAPKLKLSINTWLQSLIPVRVVTHYRFCSWILDCPLYGVRLRRCLIRLGHSWPLRQRRNQAKKLNEEFVVWKELDLCQRSHIESSSTRETWGRLLCFHALSLRLTWKKGRPSKKIMYVVRWQDPTHIRNGRKHLSTRTTVSSPFTRHTEKGPKCSPSQISEPPGEVWRGSEWEGERILNTRINRGKLRYKTRWVGTRDRRIWQRPENFSWNLLEYSQELIQNTQGLSYWLDSCMYTYALYMESSAYVDM
jgi:hypothetical protein